MPNLLNPDIASHINPNNWVMSRKRDTEVLSSRGFINLQSLSPAIQKHFPENFEELTEIVNKYTNTLSLMVTESCILKPNGQLSYNSDEIQRITNRVAIQPHFNSTYYLHFPQNCLRHLQIALTNTNAIQYISIPDVTAWDESGPVIPKMANNLNNQLEGYILFSEAHYGNLLNIKDPEGIVILNDNFRNMISGIALIKAVFTTLKQEDWKTR